MVRRPQGHGTPLLPSVYVKGSLPPRRSLHARLGKFSRRGSAAVLSLGDAFSSIAFGVVAGIVFLDLDRTLLGRASGKVLNAGLVAEGVVAENRALPGQGLVYAAYDRFGESLLAIGLARATARIARGWRQDDVRRAAKRSVEGLMNLLQPFAPDHLADFRRAGHQLVLTTTTPTDMIEPFAEALGLDGVIATRYEVRDGRYTGRLEGGFIWGLGKLQAARRWAAALDVDMADCIACSDSIFDLPLLSSVGDPRAVNPDVRLEALAMARRWPIEHWDRPPGVPSIIGFEPYHILRPFLRPETFPYARFDIRGIERIPHDGPAILASNHRSYFDFVTLAIVAAKLGRPVRFLAKRELFQVPVASWAARAIGGIPVDRGTSAASEPLRAAEASLRAGEVVIVLPQGTIPRGPAFFDPVLRGKTGTARLAAASDAPVIPIGIWGSEEVWPRSSRLPHVSQVVHPPTVRVRVGGPVNLAKLDAVTDTEKIMTSIVSLLPAKARRHLRPSPEQLARTYPPDTAAELDH